MLEGRKVGSSVLGVGLKGKGVWFAPGTQCQKTIWDGADRAALWLDVGAQAQGSLAPLKQAQLLLVIKCSPS